MEKKFLLTPLSFVPNPFTQIGSAIRFERSLSERTCVCFTTYGYVLRLLLSDPLLEEYGVLMLDEAHERSVDADLLLALLKKLLRVRSDLRLIVASATIDSSRWRDFFSFTLPSPPWEGAGRCAVLGVDGRGFDVKVFHIRTPVADYIRAAAEAAVGLHRHAAEGGILVFLPGQEEIDTAVEYIDKLLRPEDAEETDERYVPHSPTHTPLSFSSLLF